MPFFTLLQLLVDADHPAPEVHTVPGDAQGFRLADAGEQDHFQKNAVFLVLLGHLQQQRDLVVRQRFDLVSFDPGQDHARAGIAADISAYHRHGHGLAQNAVGVLNRLRRDSRLSPSSGLICVLIMAR